MEPDALQMELFQSIKLKLPSHFSLADSIASVLKTSTDSAYRRIRGEKQLTLSELHALCSHFNISFDQLMNRQTDAFLFNGRLADPRTFNFSEYMTNVVQNTAYLTNFREKEFYYLSKDIPVFHYFHFREFAAFKYFFWVKTILQLPGFAQSKIDFDAYPEELFEKGKKCLYYYNMLDSTELWNIETVHSSIRQIDFYREAGFFNSTEDAWRVYDALEKLTILIEQQAATGIKCNTEDGQSIQAGKFSLYFNEVTILDNSMLAITDNIKTVFLIHSAINFMMTHDAAFCDNMYRHVHALMKKSTLISSVSEKERTRFFRILREKIKIRKDAL